VPTPLIGNDAFQEVDIVGITRPCTKHNYLVKDVRELAHVIRQAFYLARSGRPGPVLVDLPKDVMQVKTKFIWPEDVKMRSYNPNVKPHAGQIKKVAQLIRDAERPIIYAGGGVITSKGHQALTWLAQNLHIPVTATLMGLGCFPGDDKLWLGMLGMHGTYAANMAINNADLVLAVGARFDDRVTGKVSTFAPKATLVHIDIDPTSIQKNVSVHVPLVADCRLALEALKDELEPSLTEYDFEGGHMPWVAKVRAWAKEHPLTYKPSETTIKPQSVVEKIHELTKGAAVICTEVGQHQMWAAQFYRFNEPNCFLSSGGLGTMGYGFPAAIGAQFARPDKLVIDIAGDGSIQMNIQEMATSVCNNLGVKIVILNNGYLGMVRQWQELFYNKNYCSTCMDAQPDFVKLAEAYGATGFRIADPKDLERVLKQALDTPGTVIVDVRVEREENVYPMVPAGASLTDMLLV
jgi:acetolactate synthase I/II/III large subunit